MTSALLQAKYRDVAYRDRITYTDPENLLERIWLVNSIERAYYLGMISYRQVQMLCDFAAEDTLTELETTYGKHAKEELLAAFQALQSITNITDDELSAEDAKKTKELSDTLTFELLIKDNQSDVE